MFFQDISYVTALIATVVAMGAGFVWYAPWLFGKVWIREMRLTPEGLEELKRRNGPKGMMRTYSLSVILVFLTALVMSALMNSLLVVGIWGLVLVGFLMWLGFSMPTAANYVLYGRDSLVLFAINSGYQLVSLVLVALVVGIFG